MESLPVFGLDEDGYIDYDYVTKWGKFNTISDDFYNLVLVDILGLVCTFLFWYGDLLMF
jgi:hypothetical protein